MTIAIPATIVLGGATRNPASSAQAPARQSVAVQQRTSGMARDQTTLSGLGQLSSALATFQAMSQSIAGGGLQMAAVAAAPGS